MIIACDIDGTIADCREPVRNHLMKVPKDWDAYYKATPTLPVIHKMAFIIAALETIGDNAYFVTGRPEHTRKDTLLWLAREVFSRPSRMINNRRLLMRKDHDYRPAWEIKMEMYAQIMPTIIFDDDEDVVRHAADAGYLVLQVHGYRIPQGSKSDGVPYRQ